MKRRKDGRWLKFISINGERVAFYSRAETEKKALKDIEQQLLDYKEKEEKGKTFSEVAEEWEEQHYKNLQWQTVHRYKSLVSHICDYFGGDYIKNITSKDIENFLMSLVLKKYSTKSLKDQTSVTKMIFRYAAINKYTEQDASLYITAPKGTPKTTRESLSLDEVELIKNNIGLDFGEVAYFLLYTGLRKGEALALTYEDIDFENDIIKITKSVEHHNNTPHIKLPKTSAGTREVPLLKNVKEMLLKKKHKKTDLIFSQNGKHMSRSYFEIHWSNYCKAIGAKITAHQLRHTFATMLFEWKIDVKISQEILGHADISTTQNIYTHVRKNKLEEATKQINNLI